ncbi:MAG: hypothetical protein WA802_15420 [Terracidiphilus sp.]
MALRKVTKAFYALRLTQSGINACNELEGYDGPGDVLFRVGDAPLNDSFNLQADLVNGREFVHFTFSLSSYCVERSIYESSTESIRPQQGT